MVIFRNRNKYMKKNRFDEIGNLNSINGNWDQTLIYKLFSPEWKDSILTQLTGPNNVPVAISPYYELLTAEKTTIIELKSIYGYSDIRDNKEEIGSGTVTNNYREYQCNINGINSEARLESRQRGRYISGKSSEYGIGVRTNTNNISGDTILKWGALNDTNGMYFGVDSDGLFVAILDDGTENKVYQEDWNIDKMDGTGVSGLTLVLTEANIFNIEFTWYGYGVITFKVQVKTEQGMNLLTVHNYIIDNQSSIQNPNLPITATVGQNTNDDDISLFVAGRQFSILGTYTPTFRSSSEYFINKSIPTLGTNPVPILSFKQKEIQRAVDSKLAGMKLVTDNQIIIECYVADESSLNTPNWVNLTRVDADETAFEVDTESTTFNSNEGNIIYRDIIDGATGNRTNSSDFRDLFVDIPQNKILVITGFATETTASVDGIIRIREEW